MGMFDDLEKQAPAPAAKSGSLFADLKQQAKTSKSKQDLFADLKAAPAPQETAPEVKPVEQPTGGPGLFTGPSAGGDAGRMEAAKFLGIDPDSEIAKHLGPGRLELAANAFLKKAHDWFAEKSGLDRATAAFDKSAEDSVVPGSPLKTVAKAAPAVAGSTLAELGKTLMPASVFDLMMMAAGGKANAVMDEALAVGGNAAIRTAPNATSQMLRSMMEVEDPVLKARLLKAAAPPLLGGKAAQSMGFIPVGKIGANELDPVVEKILSGAKENGATHTDLIARGLSTLNDKDLELMGGKRLVKEVAKIAEKSKNNPEVLDELLTNFTGPQQRVIARRGLDAINLESDDAGLWKRNDYVNKAMKALNDPRTMSNEQADAIRSIGIRENLKGLKGVAEETPNLEKVEQALSARAPRSGPLQTVLNSAKKLIGETQDLFEFQNRLKKFPQLRAAFADMEGYPIRASREATSLVGSIVESLPNKEEFETFRKFVILQDWKESLEAGTKITNGISLDEVNTSLAKLGEKITPNVMDAAERHYTVVKAMGEDLVKRGYLTEDMLRDKYFAHRVISYLDDITGSTDNPNGSGFGAPFRTYVLPRVSSAAEIDTDYINVMHKLFTKVKIDNAIDDFVRGEATKVDILDKLPTEIRESMFGASGTPKVGQIYDVDGKTYRGFRYSPKNVLFPAQSKIEKLVADAIDNSLNSAELDERLKPLNESLQNRKVMLVPDEAADAFLRFNQPQNLGHMYDIVRNSTRFWKRMTLATAGLPWQTAVFEGSLEALYREGDFGAISRIPEAMKMIVKNNLNPSQLDPLFKRAMDAGIATAPVVEGVTPAESPELLKFLDKPDQFKEAAKLMISKPYDLMSNMSVGSPKLAKFLADTARVANGEAVVTKTWGPELEGLSAEQKVIRANKLTLVEFSANNPRFNTMFRDFMFPFASFFYNNAKGWGTYIARNPGDFVGKFAVPYAMMQYWNWSKYPEVEKELEPYQKLAPHVVTGWKDENGRYITVNFHSTAQLAGKWLAADAMFSRISRVVAGDLDLEDAVKDQIKDTINAPFEAGRGLLNPVVSSMMSLALNHKKKEEGGGQIVPDRLVGTTQGANLQYEYLLKNMVTPLSTFIRTEIKQEAEPANPYARFLRYGPLDVTRALGLHKVDLAKAERAMRFTREEEAKVLNNQNYANVEDAYVKAQLTGNDQQFQDAMEKNRDKIEFPQGKSLAHYLKSPRVQLRIMREKLKGSTNADERKQLLNDISEFEEIQSLKSVKTAPRQSRDFILEGAGGQ